MTPSDIAQCNKHTFLDTFPVVLVIVINWNGKNLLLDCLESLIVQDYPNERCRILVIDNGSNDGSQSAIKKNYPYVELLENESNLGYVKAVNQGIAQGLAAHAEYMWILNNDVIVERHTLQRLVEVGEHEGDSGILAPVVYDQNIPDRVENAGYNINYWTGRLKKMRLGVDIFSTPDSYIQDVDSNMGCANLIKASVFKQIGLFKPFYEIYFEETDFNVRARKRNFRVVLVRSAKVWHKTAATMNRRLLRRAFLLLRNLFIFELLHARPYQWLVFIPYFFFIHIPTFLVRGIVFAYKSRIRGKSKFEKT